MAKYNLLLPRMGESVSEATLVKWSKQIGDKISLDDTVLEIATDKVDSDVPSPVEGILVEQLFEEGNVIQVGECVAVIEIEGTAEEEPQERIPEPQTDEKRPEEGQGNTVGSAEEIPGLDQVLDKESLQNEHTEERFYSPLVKSIAQKEGISFAELAGVKGTGLAGRITKQDLFSYLKNRNSEAVKAPNPVSQQKSFDSDSSTPSLPLREGEEIIEMDRMRKLIANHMTESVRTAPHVTSFLEVDVTNVVKWRNKNKASFEAREGTRITYTPIFIEAITKAIRDFPMINVSVQGTNIIKKSQINIGMATALPSGNLIVPVIKNADRMNLAGLSRVVNDLATRSRENKLKPDEIQGGTFTLTNIGSFGNLMGTPIINQPQVAILAVGAIVKKPAVLETKEGDVIAIRHKMYLSLSYDHRVVDGALGGMFLKRIADYLEDWDTARLV